MSMGSMGMGSSFVGGGLFRWFSPSEEAGRAPPRGGDPLPSGAENRKSGPKGMSIIFELRHTVSSVEGLSVLFWMSMISAHLLRMGGLGVDVAQRFGLSLSVFIRNYLQISGDSKSDAGDSLLAPWWTWRNPYVCGPHGKQEAIKYNANF